MLFTIDIHKSFHHVPPLMQTRNEVITITIFSMLYNLTINTISKVLSPSYRGKKLDLERLKLTESREASKCKME